MLKVYLFDFKKAKKILYYALTAILSAVITIAALIGFDHVFYNPTSEVGAEAKRIDTVIIDAGHGGEDCGAIGTNGVYEKDINLAVSILLKEELESRGYNVIMTRTEDKMLYSEQENIKGMRKLSDLKNRCGIANEHPDALLVSIHMNSFGASEYSGLQVYYATDNSESRALASAIQDSVRNTIQKENTRSVKDGSGLYILDNSEPTSVIIECGFLSNAAECEKLSQKEYQKELSLSIVCGIISYIENKQG